MITYDADNDGANAVAPPTITAPGAERPRLEKPLVLFFKSKFRASFEAVQRRGLAIIQRIIKAPPHYRDPA